MSEAEGISAASCNAAEPSSASAATSRSTVVVTHEDDFCERRRQQNREAQRRFRNKKIKEREEVAAAAASTTAFSGAPSTAVFIASATSTSPSPPPPHRSSFSYGSFPEFETLSAPYLSATNDESNFFTAASSIASPPAPYPPFDTLQHASYFSLASLDGNGAVDDEFSLDELFGRQSSGHSMSDHAFDRNPPTSLTPSRLVPIEHSFPTSTPPTTSGESYPPPSRILPGPRPHPDNQGTAKASNPSQFGNNNPPTPTSSRKHTPSPPPQTHSPSSTDEATPLLHISIDSGHEGMVRVLLDSGVDINERDHGGSTALHLAVQKRQEAIIRLLLDRGASTSVKDSQGKTPTHLAIYANFETGLKILLDHDANVKNNTNKRTL